eukprot:6182519-Pleurochrysis_carterae.AAC.2
MDVSAHWQMASCVEISFSEGHQTQRRRLRPRFAVALRGTALGVPNVSFDWTAQDAGSLSKVDSGRADGDVCDSERAASAPTRELASKPKRSHAARGASPLRTAHAGASEPLGSSGSNVRQSGRNARGTGETSASLRDCAPACTTRTLSCECVTKSGICEGALQCLESWARTLAVARYAMDHKKRGRSCTGGRRESQVGKTQHDERDRLLKGFERRSTNYAERLR